MREAPPPAAQAAGKWGRKVVFDMSMRFNKKHHQKQLPAIGGAVLLLILGTHGDQVPMRGIEGAPIRPANLL